MQAHKAILCHAAAVHGAVAACGSVGACYTALLQKDADPPAPNPDAYSGETARLG